MAGSKKAAKKKINQAIQHIRALGKTVAEKRAIDGPGLPKHMDRKAAEDPLTAPQIATTMTMRAWVKKMNNMAKSIQNLDPQAPGKNRRYMEYRLAWYHAVYLAATFVLQTNERLGTAHGLVPGCSWVWISVF